MSAVLKISFAYPEPKHLASCPNDKCDAEFWMVPRFSLRALEFDYFDDKSGERYTECPKCGTGLTED